jgi:diacylglycerol kinase family enzyme
MEVVTDSGMRYAARGVIISNGRLYGGRFVVSPGASLHRDSLAVCLLLRGSRWGLLRTVARIVAGRPLGSDEAIQLRARHIQVLGAGVPVQVDGDSLGELPRGFRAVFGEVRLVLPPRTRQGTDP